MEVVCICNELTTKRPQNEHFFIFWKFWTTEFIYLVLVRIFVFLLRLFFGYIRKYLICKFIWIFFVFWNNCHFIGGKLIESECLEIYIIFEFNLLMLLVSTYHIVCIYMPYFSGFLFCFVLFFYILAFSFDLSYYDNHFFFFLNFIDPKWSHFCCSG